MHLDVALIDPSFKVILFDHDDTLVGTIKAKWAQHKFIARTFYGKELTDDELRLHWGKPLTILMKLLYGTDHIDMAMSYNIATRPQFPKLLFKNTIMTLNALRKAGKILGLVTATTRASLKYDFQTLGIPEQMFELVQTEDDTIFHKPDPRVFEPVLKWISTHGIQPHEVLYIGDDLNDMIPAKKAGLGFIGVGTGLTSVEKFESNQVKAIHRLPDLISSKK